VVVSPVYEGCWWWESEDHYKDQYLRSLLDEVSPTTPISLSLLSSLVPPPPPISSSPLLAFLRSYPEHFLIEVPPGGGVEEKGLVRRNDLLILPQVTIT